MPNMLVYSPGKSTPLLPCLHLHVSSGSMALSPVFLSHLLFSTYADLKLPRIDYSADALSALFSLYRFSQPTMNVQE